MEIETVLITVVVVVVAAAEAAKSLIYNIYTIAININLTQLESDLKTIWFIEFNS
jgi:hypothetical protein